MITLNVQDNDIIQPDDNVYVIAQPSDIQNIKEKFSLSQMIISMLTSSQMTTTLV
jgi:hypothetical protein